LTEVNNMRRLLEKIKIDAARSLSAAKSMPEVDGLRVRYLGKKGELTTILKQMGTLTDEERPVIGKMANEIREFIEQVIADKMKELGDKMLAEQLLNERIDVTLPGTLPDIGRRHPLSIVLNDIKQIFLGMGFDVAEGPQIEHVSYNFDMLNIPESHPSRDVQDTFYVTEDIVLRTQTSPVQVRVMKDHRPPIRVIAPGRVYRRDTVDATHSPVFHQIEGLVVDKYITMSDLKGTLETFAKKLYASDISVRFRPHHFPFTEPSAEMDATCFVCRGEGCSLCKGEGFIEILGCGMVHPKVLENCGIDPNEYSGYAFGLGLDRITMMRYGIDDLRLLFENDIRFLRQF
jgi:phenylalanyl-tRNA synthetase alpha chain